MPVTYYLLYVDCCLQCFDAVGWAAGRQFVLYMVVVVVVVVVVYACVQDYDEMVSLIEDMDAVPNLRVTNTVGIQNLYAFALNRRNASGDRDKALVVIHKVSLS